ncbi:MAG TPA: DoxX family protein [Parafilimonas sp.]|nr:DoxX family protein [Parafilimonas sp.]
MKKILSIKYSAGAFNFSMLLLRIVFGLLIIINHGYFKLENFSTMQSKFYNFLGLGMKTSLVLCIFAEVLCALFVVLGLFTRFATIPLVITMLVAIFGANADKPLLESELALLYLGAFTTLLFCGPGKISVDGMINK